MEFIEAVRRRRMVRNYASEPVPAGAIERIVAIARRAPSAGFAQGHRFVVVTEERLRHEIARIAGEDAYKERGFDAWLSSAPVHVVVCVDRAAYRNRYEAPDKRAGGSGPDTWDVSYELVDAGGALMLLLLAAVDEGLAAGFLGAHRLPGLKPLLGIPEHVTPIGVVTIGHPAPDRRASSLDAGWRPLDEVVRWERWERDA